MLTSTPPIVAPGPVSTFPADFGLFSAVQMPAPPSDGHWVNGITWEHSACAAVTGFAGDCEEELLELAFPGSRNVIGEASSFTLYGSHTCAPVGNSPEQIQSLARENLQRHQQEGVEAAIWTGSLSNTPNLQGATDLTPTPGTAVSVKRGLGLLAQHAAATYGASNAVIHVPRIVGVHISDYVNREAGSMTLKATGDSVSLGAGYPNTSPTGTTPDAGDAWLYVTPPVLLLATEITSMAPAPVFDHGRNLVMAEAYRTFVVAWDDCPVAAVLVELT